ncbi:class I SAM-dependent methyltransferase [Devosia sp. RR2S18]|uniref:class I SAM-dependent methyltransferase n=1 Tax=Devosia rhizosphaerae TaxID=3049774 RepID=UPI002541661A|nr:class I SAM-dependent methyltransferase [Devosia sp. RR2S18]WIJ26409.1 class I SAM-dependent methyltransferase [Devosia sp. RR2S18]
MARNHNNHFANPAAIASYVENAQKNVPGLTDLHRMVMLLLAEHTQGPADILVVGAGGGMETKVMAEAQPEWCFTGVDPSAAMLDLARQTLGSLGQRVTLIEGTIDQVLEPPFDGATCLLTMHHLDRSQRLHLLRETRARLKLGAPLVTVEHSAPSPDAALWMARSVAFSDRNGPDWDKARSSGQRMTEHLTLLSSEAEQDLLLEAGFGNVAMFYAAFSFRGWIATAGTT